MLRAQVQDGLAPIADLERLTSRIIMPARVRAIDQPA
jgi:hypothetical protein